MNTISPVAVVLALGLFPSEAHPMPPWQESASGDPIVALNPYRDDLTAGLLDRAAHLQVTAVSMQRALDELQRTSGVAVAYSPTLLPHSKTISCECIDASVGEAMETILSGSTLDFLVLSNQLVVRQSIPRLTPGRGPVLAQISSTLRNPPPLRPTRTPPDLSRVQAVGTITGRITTQSGQPLAAAQVYISSLNIGVLTQVNGGYVLLNVPAGTHSVAVERIGYRTITADVSVSDGATAVQDFVMEEDALRLDEVIVTGTAGGTQRRAIGNSVGRLTASEITEAAPVASVQDLIGGREPGVSFSGQSGMIGGGSIIRIRGTSSFSLTDQPLIYVDGIRVDNTVGVGPTGYGGRQGTRLEDFNPEDIESIEIIKGAAAATLYGTEASAGVIQIITKRGQAGPPQFDVKVSQGINWLMNPEKFFGTQYYRDPDTGLAAEMPYGNIFAKEIAEGRGWLENGYSQAYNVSMRGGTDNARYFLSGDWHDDTGMVSYNTDRALSLRANVNVVVTEDLTFDVSTGYIDGSSRFMNPENGFGEWEQGIWAIAANVDTPSRGFYIAPPEAFEDVEATRDYSRFTGSGTVTHTPWDWFTHRLTIGTDVANDENRRLFPRNPAGDEYFFKGLSLGDLLVERPIVRSTTLDYNASGTLAWNPELSFTTSVGAQYFARSEDQVVARGREFASTAVTNLAGTTFPDINEVEVDNKTFGLYVQEEVNIRDRIFLTAALRGDDNSTFGESFDIVTYPKFSGTWVMSEEQFWPDIFVNQLRVRAAWGQSGRQPSTFAAVTLYQPDRSVESQPGFRPAVLGNPDVGPEVTSELELGFDAAFLDDRLGTEFTYYTQDVKDALLDTPVAPSVGFPGSQAVNAGQLSNWGWELSVRGTPVQLDNYNLELGASISHNENRIDDLGGLAPTANLQEGFPYPNLVSPFILSAEWADEPGGAVNSTCDAGVEGFPGGEAIPCANAPSLLVGSTNPTYEMGFDAALTLYQNLRLFGRVDVRAGDSWARSSQHGFRHAILTSKVSIERNDPLFIAANSGFFTRFNQYNYGFQREFAKLRELSLQYTVPTDLAARIGASRLAVTVAGRNLWTIWQGQEESFGVPTPDPESQGSAESGPFFSTTVPPLSSFLVTVRASF